MKRKILVIPPHFIEPDRLKIRLIEIARLLSNRHEVYLLGWNAAIEKNLILRIKSCFKDFFRKQEIIKKDKFNMVGFPLLHRPLCLAPKVNAFFLKEFIGKNNIEIVLSGAMYMFDFPKEKKFKYILDVADSPFGNDETKFDKFIYERFLEEAKKADTVTVVSGGLKEFVKDRCVKEAIVLSNGVYVDKLRNFIPTRTDGLKEEAFLENKWVIGYIGYIGSWVEVEFMIKVLRRIQRDIPNAALLFVGPSDNLVNLRKKFTSKDVIFTGEVLEDINIYFNRIDMGVLPHSKNYYQDVAFHIKLLEYTAARKFVV